MIDETSVSCVIDSLASVYEFVLYMQAVFCSTALYCTEHWTTPVLFMAENWFGALITQGLSHRLAEAGLLQAQATEFGW